jgi:hypothetical protein
MNRYSTAPDGTGASPWVIWDNQPDDPRRKYDLYQDAAGNFPAFSRREDALALLATLNEEKNP